MKLSRKQLLVINLVNNIPLAVVISTVAPLIAHTKITLGSWLTNVLLAFLFACLVGLIFPIQKWGTQIPLLFHLNPKGLLGRLIANIPIGLVYVIVIGLVLNLYNVRQFPAFIFAFLGTFIQIYIVVYIVSLMTTVIAERVAFGSVDQLHVHGKM